MCATASQVSAPGDAELEALDAEVARELDVRVAVSDHRRALAIERRGVDEVAHEPDRRLAARAVGFGQVRAREIADEADPLRREQREQGLIGALERGARIVGPAQARLIRDDHELVAGGLQPQQGGNHARDERLLARVRETLALRDERAAAIHEQHPTHDFIRSAPETACSN